MIQGIECYIFHVHIFPPAWQPPAGQRIPATIRTLVLENGFDYPTNLAVVPIFVVVFLRFFLVFLRHWGLSPSHGHPSRAFASGTVHAAARRLATSRYFGLLQRDPIEPLLVIGELG